MKKLIALTLAAASLLCCLVGCSETIKEYDKTPLTSLTYTQVDYNGGFTTEYLFDFDNNLVIKHSFLPGDNENDRTETLAEFSDEQEKTLIDRLYTYGLFDIKEKYKSPPGIVDGGGWTLQINYNDGTSKTSSGSNNSPKSVFSDCAKAFYDICGNGVVARVPTEYYTPPNVSYAIHTTVGNDTTSQGATSLTKRGNYKWNGFEENSLDYFQLNLSYSFPYALDENTEYEFVLYTANYGDYDKFKKCEVFSYNCDEEMSGEETVVEKGWFDQIEFNLKTNKIYVIKLSFKNGDFVEYTFNTSVVKGDSLVDSNNWNAGTAWVNYGGSDAFYFGALNSDKLSINSVKHLPIYKFESSADLEQFKTNFAEDFTFNQSYDEIQSFNEATQYFNDNFFRDYTLFVVYVSANSGSLSFGVSSVYNDGNDFCIYIEQLNNPENVTDDMAGWFILLPQLKSAVEGCTTFDAQMAVFN